MKMSFVWFNVLLFNLLSLSFSATAQEPISSDSAFDDAFLFDDIPSVFTASKYEQKITEAPARISVVTANEIQRLGHRTLLDVLNSLPGFQTSYDNNYSYAGVRGMNILGDYNARLLFLVDGHRLNENIFDGVVIDQGFIIDIDLIKRVEVVRGPASSLYGNNALFGVVNIITKRGRDIDGIELSGSTGSQNSHKARISIGQKFDNGIEILLSAAGNKSEGDEKIYYAEFDDPLTNNGIAQDSDDSDSQSFYASFSYAEFSLTGAYTKYNKTIPTASYNTVFNDSRTRSRESSAYLNLKYQYLFNNGTDLTAQVYYDESHYKGDWVYDYAEENDPSDVVVWTEESVGTWWGAEVMLTQQLLDNHRITLGAEYTKTIHAQQHNYDIYETYLDIDPNKQDYALFLQDNFQVSDHLVLNLGFRHDNSSTSGSNNHPRLALIWDPIESTNVKFIYGTAFRAPNSYELDFHDNGESQKAATNLESETIKTTEFIIEQKLSTNFNLIASLYKNTIENLIALVLDPSDELLVFTNHVNASAKGIELEIMGRWQQGWESSISYNYQEAEYGAGAGATIPNTANRLVKFNLLTPTWNNGISAALELNYENGRQLINGGKTDSSSVSNLSVMHNDLADGLLITAGIYNLFDKNYSLPAGEEHLQQQLKQYERTYRIKFTYTY